MFVTHLAVRICSHGTRCSRTEYSMISDVDAPRLWQQVGGASVVYKNHVTKTRTRSHSLVHEHTIAAEDVTLQVRARV